MAVRLFLHLVIFSGIIFLANCNSRRTTGFKYFKEFPEKISLVGVSIELERELFNPVQIDLLDSFLIIKDIGDTDNMLHFYGLNSFEHLFSTGKTGQGPGEFIGLYEIDGLVNRDFWAFDVTSKSITKINIDSARMLKNYVPGPEVNIRNVDVGHVLQLTDSTFLVALDGYKNRFAIANSELDTIESFGENLEIPNIFNLPESTFLINVIGNIGQFKLSKKISKNCIVLSHAFADLLQIIDYKQQKVLVNIVGPEKNYPPKYVLNGLGQAVPEQGCKEAYNNVCLTDAYIYALYCGKDAREPGSYLGNQIFAFDWQGNPIRKILLDQEIVSFVLDESKKQIIGINPLSERSLVVWKIDDVDIL